MATVNDVEALLDETARDVEKSLELQASTDARDGDSRRLDRPRDRDRRDRSRDRNRESNGYRRRSRERDHRRREGSRPRSSKDADTNEDGDRRRDSRDRYRGGARRGRPDAGGDYYSGSGRARSRSPRRDRDDKYRARDRSRDRRGGGHAGEGRNTRRSKTASPEVTEDDRDKRTIFVQQISQRAETRHLRQFFETIGPVVEAQIVKDRVTGRSKG
jgi:RNA-binding protein 39